MDGWRARLDSIAQEHDRSISSFKCEQCNQVKISLPSKAADTLRPCRFCTNAARDLRRHRRGAAAGRRQPAPRRLLADRRRRRQPRRAQRGQHPRGRRRTRPGQRLGLLHRARTASSSPTATSCAARANWKSPCTTRARFPAQRRRHRSRHRPRRHPPRRAASRCRTCGWRIQRARARRPDRRGHRQPVRIPADGHGRHRQRAGPHDARGQRAG